MITEEENVNYYKAAFALSVFTIIYNLIEGAVSTLIGFSDDSLTLFGFGLDSFTEMISGIGILHMVTRIKKNPKSHRDNYERTALKITGFSFYLIVVGLSFTSIYNFISGNQPENTFYGVIISIVSILIMIFLLYKKMQVGKALNSEAIISDAKCTRVCIYMSVVLLVSSALYEWFSLPYIDSVGALVLAYFSFQEGKECFEKSKSDKYCSCG